MFKKRKKPSSLTFVFFLILVLNVAIIFLAVWDIKMGGFHQPWSSLIVWGTMFVMIFSMLCMMGEEFDKD